MSYELKQLGFDNIEAKTNHHLSGVLESNNVSSANTLLTICGNARHIPLRDSCIDLILTSPPYWRKKDYGITNQIGQERTPNEYIDSLIEVLKECRRVLRPLGAVFINIGDTYYKKSLIDIPGLLAAAARKDNWIIRNKIVWAKDSGKPEPVKNRLVNRHEYIYHLTVNTKYYYDLFGYSVKYGNGSNPGDVWLLGTSSNNSDHPAPFPEELVERILTLACPKEVCSSCNRPRRRIVRRTTQLDTTRPQARRAMQIARAAGLTEQHIAAIQATGISDAGKGKRFQIGSGRNSAEVMRLATEAKQVLRGYFREFACARKESLGWTDCHCGKGFITGAVLDPFAGTGTVLRVAKRFGLSGVGIDLNPESCREISEDLKGKELLDKVFSNNVTQPLLVGI
ncbi:MAG: site-specific DNA-methyltransferase [Acidobacteriota bacterium]